MDLDDLQPRKKLPDIVLGEDISALSAHELEKRIARLEEEIARCAPYLDREIAALKNLKVVVALGKIGFDAYLTYLKRQGIAVKRSETLMPSARAVAGRCRQPRAPP